MQRRDDTQPSRLSAGTNAIPGSKRPVVPVAVTPSTAPGRATLRRPAAVHDERKNRDIIGLQSDVFHEFDFGRGWAEPESRAQELMQMCAGAGNG